MDDPKILQWHCSDETSEIKEIHADFTIVSDFLIPNQITDTTEISPKDAWSKGEIWHHDIICPETGKAKRLSLKRTNGLWRVSSQNNVKSLYINDHISYVLNIIEPAGEYFKQLCKKEGYRVVFGLYRAEYCNQSSFLINADNMLRMSKLCQEISILCPVYYEEENKHTELKDRQADKEEDLV